MGTTEQALALAKRKAAVLVKRLERDLHYTDNRARSAMGAAGSSGARAAAVQRRLDKLERKE